jgi:hypothetical protein
MLEENVIWLDSPDQKKFTSFRFYTELLDELSDYYRSGFYNGGPPVIALERSLKIDPVVLPLLMALGAFLKEFHKQRVTLELDNDLHSNGIIRFLEQSDFLHIAGDNENPTWPIGKRLFNFNRSAIGHFSTKGEIRSDHRLHVYTEVDAGLRHINLIENPEKRRDALIEHYLYKTGNDFEGLISEIPTSSSIRNQLVQTMAELITNGIFHSDSDVYVMMFNNRYKTTCSIADIGKGLHESLKTKPPTPYYSYGLLTAELVEKVTLSMPKNVQQSAFAIFETFYYSMLKDRQGLFDLMLNVVLGCQGYFRLHFESVQVIVSSRMLGQLNVLAEIRNDIYSLQGRQKAFKEPFGDYDRAMLDYALVAKAAMVNLARDIFQKYSEDVQFSAIRLFRVKLRGVHIEAEFPKND